MRLVCPSVQSSYVVIRFAAQNRKRPSALTQEFKQPNFIVRFEANFLEFYAYDIALKHTVHTLLAPAYFPILAVHR